MYNGKVDLHLHLDGAITETFFRKYAHKYGLVVPADLRAALSVTSGCRDLRDYLRCFSLPTQLLQWEDVLEECAYDLIRRLSAQGLLYAEIRFAPTLHCRKGLSQNAAVAAVLSGIRRAKAAFPAIYVNLLLCFLVGDDMHHYETLRTAHISTEKGLQALIWLAQKDWCLWRPIRTCLRRFGRWGSLLRSMPESAVIIPTFKWRSNGAPGESAMGLPLRNQYPVWSF